METPETPGRRFRRFAADADLSAAQLGRLLSPADPDHPVTDAAVLGWFEDKVPRPCFRDAIAVLTAEWPDGPIEASEWGLTKTEARDAARVVGVEPYPMRRPVPSSPSPGAVR